ncbi:transporter substrate-binding domain-containing protein [Desulfobacterales bacterium HSG2]|nr:transporter substrate-binding domain-containing protein [Desulfobacterales bacterium HSG2]
MHIEKTVILARKGTGMKATRLEELEGKRVGVVRGYMYGTEFDSNQKIKKIVCNNDEQLVRILGRGRVPLIAGAEEGSMRYLCKQANVEVEVLCVLNGIPSYIGFSKKALGERGKVLAEKFSKALRQLKEEGFIKKIESRYF